MKQFLFLFHLSDIFKLGSIIHRNGNVPFSHIDRIPRRVKNVEIATFG